MGAKNIKPAGMYRYSVLFLSLGFFLTTCRQAPRYEVTGESGGTVAMNVSCDSLPVDPVLDSVLLVYKSKVDEVMSKKIGVSEISMEVGRPQSLLSDFTADVLYEKSVDYTGRKIDFSVINIGGIRTSLNRGEVTMGNIFSIFPFENRLTLVAMKGDAVQELFENIAAAKGEGISRQVKLRLTPDYRLDSALISGVLVDPDRIYQVATIDYLADGNDGLVAFKKAEERIDMDKRLRDMMLEYISEQTSAGKALYAETDDRIRIEP